MSGLVYIRFMKATAASGSSEVTGTAQPQELPLEVWIGTLT